MGLYDVNRPLPDQRHTPAPVDHLPAATVYDVPRQDERIVLLPGEKGDPGDPGPAGQTNLFVQEGPAPTMPTPGLWIELNPDGSVKTMWVGTNP